MASTGSVSAALYGWSRRGLPCSSISHSMVPLSAFASMCDACRLTRSPTFTVDLAVFTRKRGTARSRPGLHRPDLEIPLNVFRVEHGADDGAEDQPLRDRAQTALLATEHERHLRSSLRAC